MSVRLIGLDKHEGMRPVGVVEIWRHIFDNIVLKVTGPDATITYKDYQLCAGLKAGIDGAFHGVQAVRDETSTTEN